MNRSHAPTLADEEGLTSREVLPSTVRADGGRD